MKIEIQPATLNGTIKTTSSKAQTHRALICASLADQPTRIVFKNESDDISATINCLSMLGANIMRDGEGFTIHQLMRESDESVNLLCGESGSTFLFLLPIVGALGRDASFSMTGRLPERPLSPLYEELTHHGCRMSAQGSIPYQITGWLAPGRFALPANVSSQFISSLLFSLPLLRGTSYLHLYGEAESSPYIDMTSAMLKLFGIEVGFDDGVYTVPGKQVHKSPGIIHLEGDWTSTAYWLSAGAISGGSVTCTGLNHQSLQGDRLITDILARFGARISTTDSSVSASAGILQGTEIDARNIPDLVPILAAVGAVAEGDTVIRNAGRLRFKESNRLLNTGLMLRSFGVDIDETTDGLIVHGGASLRGSSVSTYGDHRIAMSAAILAAVSAETVVLSGAEAVNKSHPCFYDELRGLGASVQVL